MSSIHREPNTSTFAAPHQSETPDTQKAQAKTSTSQAKTSAIADDFDAKTAKATKQPTAPVASPTAPRPTTPGRKNSRADMKDSNVVRSQSARTAPRTQSTSADSLRAARSEPANMAKAKEPGPRDYQEHFFELGDVFVDPRYHPDAQKLATVCERKEGLKIYLHESKEGKLYAISHAAKEAELPEGTSTSHVQLQQALFMLGCMRGAGRYATDNAEVSAAQKAYGRTILKSKNPSDNGGLRLQKLDGQYVVDVSGSFSFHGASNENMEHIARFYATVLLHAEPPAERVNVIDAETSCNKQACLQAAPHLQDLARRINDILDE